MLLLAFVTEAIWASCALLLMTLVGVRAVFSGSFIPELPPVSFPCQTVFDIWNNKVIIRLFEKMKHFNVSFCTKGPVCKIWQHLVAGIVTRVLGLEFKGDLEPAAAAGGPVSRLLEVLHIRLVTISALVAAFTGCYVTNLERFQELFVRPGLFLPSSEPVPFTGVFLNALECCECKPSLPAARLAPRNRPRPGRAGAPCVPTQKTRHALAFCCW